MKRILRLFPALLLLITVNSAWALSLVPEEEMLCFKGASEVITPNTEWLTKLFLETTFLARSTLAEDFYLPVFGEPRENLGEVDTNLLTRGVPDSVLSDFKDEVVEKTHKVITDAKAVKSLRQDIEGIWSKGLDAAEREEIQRFFSSPVGQKMLCRLPYQFLKISRKSRELVFKAQRRAEDETAKELGFTLR